MDASELVRVYELLEDLNHFFHQPLHYESKEDVSRFAAQIYPALHDAYYKVVWNWLPEDIQHTFISRREKEP